MMSTVFYLFMFYFLFLFCLFRIDSLVPYLIVRYIFPGASVTDTQLRLTVTVTIFCPTLDFTSNKMGPPTCTHYWRNISSFVSPVCVCAIVWAEGNFKNSNYVVVVCSGRHQKGQPVTSMTMEDKERTQFRDRDQDKQAILRLWLWVVAEKKEDGEVM